MPGELIELLFILHLIRYRPVQSFRQKASNRCQKIPGNAFIRHSFIHRHLDHTGRGARAGRRIAPAVDRRHFPPAAGPMSCKNSRSSDFSLFLDSIMGY